MSISFKLEQFPILALLVLSYTVQVLTSNAQPRTRSPNIEEKIQSFVQKLCTCKNIKGMTLAVVQNDRIRMAKGFGYKNLETKEKVDEKTLFGIASLTKAFAATTLAKILPENNITLTTPLSEFMNITFPSEQLNAYATLEDLLSHRTGLVKNNYLRLNQNFTRRTLHKFLKHFGIPQDFRTGFIYNNVMYGLASFITELLTNTTWENAVREQLLWPLGMNETTFSTIADFDSLNIAYPYLNFQSKGFQRISPNFTKKWGELGGSGAMLSNALDMTRWMRFLLNKGKLDGKYIMNSKTVDDIFKARNYPISRTTTFIRPNTPITISNDLYSLGWRKGYLRGFPIITHTGSTWGYKAMLTLFPVQKLGIFNAQIGSDDNYIKRRLLHSYVADLYLGEQPWLNKTSACAFPWKASKKKTVIKKREAHPPFVLNMQYDFTGIYSNQLWGNIRIEMTNAELKMIYGYGTFVLSPSTNPLVFSAVGTEEIWFMKLSSVKFETERNKVVSVTVPSFEKQMAPTFNKLSRENEII